MFVEDVHFLAFAVSPVQFDYLLVFSPFLLVPLIFYVPIDLLHLAIKELYALGLK